MESSNHPEDAKQYVNIVKDLLLETQKKPGHNLKLSSGVSVKPSSFGVVFPMYNIH